MPILSQSIPNWLMWEIVFRIKDGVLILFKQLHMIQQKLFLSL